MGKFAKYLNLVQACPTPEEMLLIPNALCWSLWKCDCLPVPLHYCSFLPEEDGKSFLQVKI